ncbi:2-dehydropantoate 2-reductase [Priestia megaterium]|nr:2-dehydropantoate 2-reductase [Priestia megaterium]
MKNIAVIGGGAIGLLFGSYMANTSRVTLYTRTDEQAQEIMKKGITLKREGEQQNISVYAESMQLKNQEVPFDLVVVAVKQYHLVDIIPHLLTISAHTPLLFIQNGMGHLPVIDQLPHENIYLGIVEHGAMREGNSTVHHSGVGVTRIATYRGTNDFINVSPTSFFSFVKEAEWYPMVVQKLVVNAVINPLTAMYQAENGSLLENPFFYKTMKALFSELNAVLRLEDSLLYWNRVVDVCKKTSHNQSSMWKDLQNHRQTEVDSILGYVVTEAEKRQLTIPVIQFIYDSIKGIERRRKG